MGHARGHSERSGPPCLLHSSSLSYLFCPTCRLAETLARSGLLGGLILCLSVAFMELFTLKVLMRQSQKHKAVSYQSLVRSAPP